MSSAAVQPPHAPVVSRRSRRLLGRFHVTGVFWYRFHRFGVVSMPRWSIPLNIFLFTSFFFLALGRMRQAVASNLAAVLGPAGFFARQRRIAGTFWSWAWCNSERFERLETTRPFVVEAEGQENWYAVAGDGTGPGFVLATAHVGSWDVGTFIASNVGTRHVHVVREQEMDVEAQKFTASLYREHAAEQFTVHFARDNPQLGARLLTALRAGAIVGLQADRPSSTGRTVETRLFGRPFVLPVGPAALVRAAEVPLLPVFCFRTGRRRYRLVIRPAIHSPRTADRDADHAVTMQALVSEIEWAIRQAPNQWFCFRQLW